MNGLRINSNKQNRTVHTAVIDEPALLALVVDHVTASLGIDAKAANVQTRAIVTSYKDGSLRTSKTRIEVELIEGHEVESGPSAAS